MNPTKPSKFSENNVLNEGIDTEKLRVVFKHNIWWVLLIFITSNLAAYLTTRWTKDIYESESELKLDIKRDATDLGINKLTQDPNQDIIAGEIEQMKSRLFINRIIDSLDLRVSYFSEGKVLFDEMYKRAPFVVTNIRVGKQLEDLPIYFIPLSEKSFMLRVGVSSATIECNYGTPVVIKGMEFTVLNTSHLTEEDTNDYYFTINSREQLITYLYKNINAEPLNFNANTIRISFKDYNALKAHDIVNKIDSLYIIFSSDQKNLANKQKIDWLNRELGQVEKRMSEFENYFEAFTLRNKSSDLGQDMKQMIYQINQLDSQRYFLNKRLIEINGLIDDFVSKKNKPSSFQYSFLPEYLNKRMDAFAKKMEEKDRLSLAYHENTLAFQQKDKELVTLKDQIFGQLNMLKENWMNTLVELNENKKKLDQEFASMPDKNTEYSKNKRFYSLYTEFYLSMMQSKAQFQIAQAGNTPDFKILSPASLPIVPVSPKKILILSIGLLIGIVLNFFFLGIAYLLNDKITSLKEIEQVLDVPVLGVIPASRLPIISSIHVNDNPKSIVSEAIRSLRTNLDFFTAGGSKKVITISSSVSGEGKSFLALNLGVVLALSNKKVAFVDLDMRKTKKINSLIVNSTQLGLSTVLIKKNTWRECIQKTPIENLDYIPSGPHPPNPSELLLNGEFTSLIDEIRQEYDFIIMDTPPVGLVTDAIMAMRKSDLSIYVIRANYSKKDFLRNIDRIISVNKLSNVAIVLNALPQSGHAYGYGYYEDKSTKKGWKNFFS